jgi:tetratricopeptide (TPR) repeat protein
MRSIFKNIGCILFAILITNIALAGSADSATNAGKAVEMEKLAMGSYVKTPDTGIYYFKMAAALYKEAGNYKAAAASLQNAAYVSDDYKKDNYNAAELMKQSVACWRMTNDTKATAAAYKYATSQHAKFNDLVNVRRKADTAVEYFTQLKDYKSIYETYLNVATMYDMQRATDSVIRYSNLALGATKKMKSADASVFKINNTMFHAYVTNDRTGDAKDIIKKNEKLIKKEGIAKEDKLNFYYYSWIYYTNTGDAKATEWKAKYDELKNAK